MGLKYLDNLGLGVPSWGPSLVAQLVRNPAANAGERREEGGIPGWVRLPGGGNGNTLHYPCLENPMDRGARRATVHGFSKNRTGLSACATQRHVPS